MTKSKKIFEEAEGLYKKYLSLRSMFYTKERRLILESVLAQKDHFSADELLFDIQKSSKKVSRATIYRSLHQMVESGILIEADFGHGHAHYEVALGNQDHIHMICSKTGEIKEVHNDELNRLVERIAKKEKFKLRHLKIQLFGEKVSAE